MGHLHCRLLPTRCQLHQEYVQLIGGLHACCALQAAQALRLSLQGRAQLQRAALPEAEIPGMMPALQLPHLIKWCTTRTESCLKYPTTLAHNLCRTQPLQACTAKVRAVHAWEQSPDAGMHRGSIEKYAVMSSYAALEATAVTGA